MEMVLHTTVLCESNWKPASMCPLPETMLQAAASSKDTSKHRLSPWTSGPQVLSSKRCLTSRSLCSSCNTPNRSLSWQLVTPESLDRWCNAWCPKLRLARWPPRQECIVARFPRPKHQLWQELVHNTFCGTQNECCPHLPGCPSSWNWCKPGLQTCWTWGKSAKPGNLNVLRYGLVTQAEYKTFGCNMQQQSWWPATSTANPQVGSRLNMIVSNKIGCRLTWHIQPFP